MQTVQNTLKTRLSEMDPEVIRAMAQDCADNRRCAILIKRNFLRGVCGYWSQSLDTLMATEIAAILRAR